MKKKTLNFPSLEQLCSFSKTLCGGYLLNTANLTLTGCLDDAAVRLGLAGHGASLVETNDKVYSYDKLG